MDIDILLLMLLMLVAMLTGLALVVVASLIELKGQTRDSKFHFALRTSGYCIFLFALLAWIAIMTHVLCVVAWIVVAAIVTIAVQRFRSGERQSLLWMMATAAERGVALDQAARAFGEGHRGRIGRQSHRLADYLEAGLPLSLALERSGFQGYGAALLAADMGQKTGTLGSALRQALQHEDRVRIHFLPVVHWLLYLSFVGLFGMFIFTFLAIKILPVLERMFREFEIALPAETRAMVELAEALSNSSGWLYALVISIVFVLVVSLEWMRRKGFTSRQWPFLHRLWWSSDSALVLQWLATGIRQQRPMLETIRLLAAYFPQHAMRVRLERAATRIHQGEDWRNSLRRARVIRGVETIIFQAAERTGNLAWALDEMAANRVRGATGRLRAWCEVAFPLTVLLAGAFVFLLVLGVFQSLISLIHGLA